MASHEGARRTDGLGHSASSITGQPSTAHGSENPPRVGRRGAVSPFDDARAASSAATSMTILGLLGLSFDAAFWALVRGAAPPAHLGAVVVLALLLLMLLLRRDRPSEVLSAVAVVGATLALVT